MDLIQILRFILKIKRMTGWFGLMLDTFIIYNSDQYVRKLYLHTEFPRQPSGFFFNCCLNTSVLLIVYFWIDVIFNEAPRERIFNNLARSHYRNSMGRSQPLWSQTISIWLKWSCCEGADETTIEICPLHSLAQTRWKTVRPNLLKCAASTSATFATFANEPLFKIEFPNANLQLR